MKKNLELHFNSIKISVCTKPIALLIFICIIIVVTIMMSVAIKNIFKGLEDVIYGGNLSLTRINKDIETDYNDYRKIGDVLNGFYESGLLADDTETSLRVIMYNQSILTQNNKKINIETEQLVFVVRGFGFTTEEIASGSNILKLPEMFMDENNISEGDTVIFAGTELVVRKHYEAANAYNNYNFHIPYTINLKDFTYVKYLDRDPTSLVPHFRDGNFWVSDTERPLTAADKKALKTLNLKQSFNDVGSSSVLALGIFIPVLIASVVNILYINLYMQKVNKRKYALYKVIGMSPYKIAGLMFAESILLVLIGCGIGILIDFIINSFLPIIYLKLQHLLWLNYLAIFVMTMIVSIAVLSVKIIKQAKAVPIDGKLLN